MKYAQYQLQQGFIILSTDGVNDDSSHMTLYGYLQGSVYVGYAGVEGDKYQYGTSVLHWSVMEYY